MSTKERIFHSTSQQGVNRPCKYQLEIVKMGSNVLLESSNYALLLSSTQSMLIIIFITSYPLVQSCIRGVNVSMYRCCFPCFPISGCGLLRGHHANSRQISGVLSFPFPPTWPKSSIEYRVSSIEYRVSDGRLKTL